MGKLDGKSMPITIALSLEGIELRSGSIQRTVAISWDSVVRIVAFKRDLYSRDLLCAAIEMQPQAVVELDESMDGWNNFIQELPAHLPGALAAERWFSGAAFPAFEVSPTEIFRR